MTLSALIGLVVLLGLIALAGAGLSRMSSMGALVAASSSTFFMVFMGHAGALLLGVILTVLVIVRHKDNIKRIKAGTEPKIGQKT